MNTEISSYLIHLDNEEKEIENRTTLSDIEKYAYISNLRLMKNYKIQRAKIKSSIFIVFKQLLN